MNSEDVRDLNRNLKKSVKSLDMVIEGFEKKIRKIVQVNLNKLEKLELKANRMMRKLTVKLVALEGDEETIQQALKGQVGAFSNIEEMFFILYHNIRQNQFLFANDEKTWWKEFLELKQLYKEQNEGKDVI